MVQISILNLSLFLTIIILTTLAKTSWSYAWGQPHDEDIGMSKFAKALDRFEPLPLQRHRFHGTLLQRPSKRVVFTIMNRHMGGGTNNPSSSTDQIQQQAPPPEGLSSDFYPFQG